MIPHRILFSLAATALVQSLGAAAPIVVKYGPPSHSTPLGTTFVAWDTLVAKPTGVGVMRPVFDNPTPALDKFEMHISTLLPGKMSHPIHEHPWEEMLFIKEGTIDATVHGELQHAGPGSLVFFASHDPHNAINNSTEPATYYVINFVTDRVHTVADKPAAEQAVPGMLGSGVFDTDHLPSTPNATGSRVNVVDSPTLTFKRLSIHTTTLNVGQQTKSDLVDDGNELFIIRSGEVEVMANGIACRLKAGSFFYAAPNDRRGLRNIGTTPASYLVIKVVSDQSPTAG
ncbi:MAG TPA: cupin domain-containing protein [Opitutaceae bacterium]|jgi:quercetin dioxygenase-like cupin family protein